MRYKAFHSELYQCWIVEDKEGEPLFGDNQPRDEREAEQCARAANLADSMVRHQFIRKITRTIDMETSAWLFA